MNLTQRAGVFSGLLIVPPVAATPVAAATTSRTDRSVTALTTIAEAASVPGPTTLMTTAAPTTAATPVDPPAPGLVSGVPAVDGYSIAEVPADDVLWTVYGFPADLTLNHALVV